mmetsp:Transcript_36975/g.104365  ORF Transcript_36975/g.104365 Transcript_36975/m.104365 type:complete len:317 (+) Transcript_36975:210-1160(+)
MHVHSVLVALAMIGPELAVLVAIEAAPSDGVQVHPLGGAVLLSGGGGAGGVEGAGVLSGVREEVEEQQSVTALCLHCQFSLGTVAPLLPRSLAVLGIREDSLAAAVHRNSLEIHQQRGDPLPTHGACTVLDIMKVVVMRIVLLAINVSEDLNAFTMGDRDVCDGSDPLLNPRNHIVLGDSEERIARRPHRAAVAISRVIVHHCCRLKLWKGLVNEVVALLWREEVLVQEGPWSSFGNCDDLSVPSQRVGEGFCCVLRFLADHVHDQHGERKRYKQGCRQRRAAGHGECPALEQEGSFSLRRPGKSGSSNQVTNLID